MQLQENSDLTKLNTLGVSARAKYFVELRNESDIEKLFSLEEFQQNKKIFLGGGSNILFTKDFDGIVILNKLQGVEILEENSDYVQIRAMSGVNWHDFVIFTVNNGYWGIENLALIPGSVGGAPVQNIGAYGVELQDVLEKVETFSILDGTRKVFISAECELGYRDSIFKNRLKDQYFIFAINIKLHKTPKPNLSYKILADYVNKHGAQIHSSKDISDIVSDIRRSKLPDPKMISNAGSFFKNVFVDQEKLSDLIKDYPDLKYFEGSSESNKIKISSAWLIESCGPKNRVSWKGYRVGDVGVHDKHALVLVNYGGGTGEQIKQLAEDIMGSVFLKFGIKLTPEVNLI